MFGRFATRRAGPLVGATLMLGLSTLGVLGGSSPALAAITCGPRAPVVDPSVPQLVGSSAFNTGIKVTLTVAGDTWHVDGWGFAPGASVFVAVADFDQGPRGAYVGHDTTTSSTCPPGVITLSRKLSKPVQCGHRYQAIAEPAGDANGYRSNTFQAPPCLFRVGQ